MAEGGGCASGSGIQECFPDEEPLFYMAAGGIWLKKKRRKNVAGIVFWGRGYYNNIRKIHFVIFYGKMHIIEKEGIMKDGEHVLSAEYENFWD
ncbi:MAG: hypothetical protein HFH84_11115 [Lachnospiraceae bacterium]|nr:hypothetical protein [Lachnospiraceae bacterium]